MARYFADGQLPDPDYFKIPKYPIWIESLKVFLLFAPAAAVILYAAFDIAGGFQYAWFAAGFFIMPWISNMLRLRLGNIILYIIIHLLFLGWLFLSPQLVLTALGTVFWISLTLYGVIRQLAKESAREASLAVLLGSMAVMIGIYVAAASRNHLDFSMTLIILSLGYGILFLFYQHWIGVHDALRSIEKEGNFSVRRIISFNNKMFLGYLAGVIILFTAAYFAGLGDLLTWLSMLLLRLIRKAARYLSTIDGATEYAEEEAMEEDMEENAFAAFGKAEAGAFWLILQKILEIVFVLIIIGFIAVACWYIFRRFSEVHRYQEQGYEETKVFYKSVPREKKKRRSLRQIFDASPENKIRKQYYKKVRNYMGKKVHLCDTPTEVAETVTEVQDIVEAYDKARYAGKRLD